jgi:Predicted AAA-ATPase
MIKDLLLTGKYYFMARPRRFGKSLLISTLKEIFKGNKQLFTGLWIENQWDWSQQYPVVHLSFDAIEYKEMTLAEGLSHELKLIADQHGFKLEASSLKLQFRELIHGLNRRQGQVVLLIDEYDKPILDYLEKSKTEQAKVNQDTLREFYAVVKSADEYLRFVFITGISKFSRVSIFSHLNNLFDITLNPQFSTLLGYTQEELEHYFEPYLLLIAEQLQLSKPALMAEIKTWYNGYSWDGQQRVYNPSSVLHFFNDPVFSAKWSSGRNVWALIEKLKERPAFNVENLEVDNSLWEGFNLDETHLIPMLFDFGYLTVMQRDRMTGRPVLGSPNQEVRVCLRELQAIAKQQHGQIMAN